MFEITVRRLNERDEALVFAAGSLFDKDPEPGATRRFLTEPTHHMLVAYGPQNAPVGFVTGVELTHPDKGTEMFLYELAVDEPARRQGVGSALVEALKAFAEERGCYGMWVLTETDNVAAQKTYARLDSISSLPQMYEWHFPAPAGDSVGAAG